MGGRGERREEKFEGKSKNSKQDFGEKRSEAEVERRRGIVYRASGRPSRVEVYMQAGGLHSNRAAASDQMRLRACDGGGCISHPANRAASRCEYGGYDLCMDKREGNKDDDYLGRCYALGSAA